MISKSMHGHRHCSLTLWWIKLPRSAYAGMFLKSSLHRVSSMLTEELDSEDDMLPFTDRLINSDSNDSNDSSDSNAVPAVLDDSKEESTLEEPSQTEEDTHPDSEYSDVMELKTIDEYSTISTICMATYCNGYRNCW